MLNWINILHFYQPPTVSDEIINEVVKSSYKPWVDFLNKHRNLKITLNFTACLTERLKRSGYKKLLKDFTKIAERGQIEFLESAAFHPILPLLPEQEIVKQIKINQQINKECFGKIYKPQGFFLPELAYSNKVGLILKKLGYKYIILDEIALSQKHKNTKTRKHENKFLINNNVKYKLSNGLFVVFRNREISNTFVPQTIINILKQKKIPQHIITATDGELYGHRYWNWYPAYSYLINKTQVKTLTASDYLKKTKKQKTIKPKACSWESDTKELKKKIPYALWQHPKNKIHKFLWQLSGLALKLNWQNQEDPNHFASRLHLEKGLASCTFWWASNKDFKKLSPHAWQPTQVEIGATELLNSIRSLEKIKPLNKIAAEKIFSQIRNLIWKKHWQK